MEFIQQNLFMIAVALISGTMLLVLSVRRPGGHNALSPAKAIQLINREDALVIDVREQAEYVGGHVADARHLPLADLANRAGELDKFKAGPVLVVCQTGEPLSLYLYGDDTRARSGSSRVNQSRSNQRIR